MFANYNYIIRKFWIHSENQYVNINQIPQVQNFSIIFKGIDIEIVNEIALKLESL